MDHYGNYDHLQMCGEMKCWIVRRWAISQAGTPMINDPNGNVSEY